MRWQGKRKSQNIEDRRASRASGIGGMSSGGGLFRLLPMIVRMLGVKGTIAVAVVLGGYGLVTGKLGDMLGLLSGNQTTASAPQGPVKESESERQLVEFVSVVLADTEQTWSEIFKAKGQTYKEPTLVLFRDSVSSACGMAQSAMGPFYCPGDQQVYIDLSFFDQLKNRFNAPGDFAQAYVIAHEVGHHLQTLLGISAKVHSAQQKLSKVDANMLSVRQELQADCFAGVWAYHANNSRQMLEQGDVEEGLNAASAIGDDTLQKQSSGRVTPDSFTHGSSADRVKWFRIGLSSGDMETCDTFSQ